MAKRCEICGKETTTGHTVSKSGRRTKRKWFPNVQPVKIRIKGQVRRAYVCTRCIRTGRIEKAGQV